MAVFQVRIHGCPSGENSRQSSRPESWLSCRLENMAVLSWEPMVVVWMKIMAILQVRTHGCPLNENHGYPPGENSWLSSEWKSWLSSRWELMVVLWMKIMAILQVRTHGCPLNENHCCPHRESQGPASIVSCAFLCPVLLLCQDLCAADYYSTCVRSLCLNFLLVNIFVRGSFYKINMS
jgi:hypothetical protein